LAEAVVVARRRLLGHFWATPICGRASGPSPQKGSAHALSSGFEARTLRYQRLRSEPCLMACPLGTPAASGPPTSFEGASDEPAREMSQGARTPTPPRAGTEARRRRPQKREPERQPSQTGTHLQRARRAEMPTGADTRRPCVAGCRRVPDCPALGSTVDGLIDRGSAPAATSGEPISPKWSLGGRAIRLAQ
jgi:hypothetical protein